MSENWSFDTLQIHAGQAPDASTNARALPIYQTTSYVFNDTTHASNLFALKELGNIYTRLMNPTTAVVEERITALEGGVGGLLVASGQAAETLAILNIAEVGDHIVSSPSLYGGTYNLFHYTLPKLGITVTFVDNPDDPQSWKAAIQPNTKAFYAESIANPKNDVLDIEAVAKVAHDYGVPLIIDNTVATPYLIQPLKHGADFVVHSATKYLDGQGRVLGGAVCGSNADMEEVFKFLRTAGPSISPFNAWVILKGMETLRIRMEAQSESALEIARRLEAHPKISRVYYPGLKSHPQCELAATQQKLGGAILSFEVSGGRAEAWRVVDGCRLISVTANLGDTKTTITHPASTTHGRITPEARKAAGIKETLLRVAVGLESVEDIYDDLLVGIN